MSDAVKSTILSLPALNDKIVSMDQDTINKILNFLKESVSVWDVYSYGTLFGSLKKFNVINQIFQESFF